MGLPILNSCCECCLLYRPGNGISHWEDRNLDHFTFACIPWQRRLHPLTHQRLFIFLSFLMQMLEYAADARMCTAVSGLVTLAEVVKKKEQHVSNGFMWITWKYYQKRKTGTPQNLLYVPTIKFRCAFFFFHLYFIHYMKLCSLLPKNKVLN